MHQAPDGRAGVRLYREPRPAVAIVDIVMPGKGGIETVKEILAIDPAALIFTMSGRDAGGDCLETARMLEARGGLKGSPSASILDARHQGMTRDVRVISSGSPPGTARRR